MRTSKTKPSRQRAGAEALRCRFRSPGPSARGDGCEFLNVLQSLTGHLHRGHWNQATQLILDAAARQTQSRCGLAGVLVETGALRVLALNGALPASTMSGANPHGVALAAFRRQGYVEFTNFDNVLGRVITSGEPVLINGLSKDLLPPGHPPVRHFLGVPMRCGKEVVGIITVANRPAGYTERELAVVAVLAQTAGMLFESYRRYQREVQLKIEREQLTRRLLQTQEAERQHLARELHDEIGQILTAIRLNLNSLQGPAGPAHLERKVPETMGLVDTLLQQVRRLSLDLHPQQLDVLGLVPALRDHVDQLSDRAGLQCRFVAAQAMPRLDPAIELACFRVAQEALTNVVRHAHARRVSVELLQDAEALHLRIQDDGVGFDYATARLGAGREGKLGLLGMEERVALVGGRLTCKSQPRHGTEIHASFPLAPAGGV